VAVQYRLLRAAKKKVRPGPLCGDNLTITGTNFLGATAVSFGSLPAVSFVVVSATIIEATMPASLALAVDVTVSGTGGDGQANSASTGVAGRGGAGGGAAAGQGALGPEQAAPPTGKGGVGRPGRAAPAP